MNTCENCDAEYDRRSRAKKPGRATICDECAEEESDVQRYTGFTVYGHKCGATLQINADPKLTQYLIAATKLKNKGSNMNDNAIQCSKYRSKTSGACVITADATDYKNRSGI